VITTSSFGPARVLSLLLCSGLLVACPVPLGDLEIEDPFLLEPAAVDVLWVVDNSGTMADPQLALGDAFPSLLFELSALAIDWQMGIVSTDMSNPDQRGRLVEMAGDGSVFMDSNFEDAASRFAFRVRLGDEGSPVERGLEASWAAISSPLASHDNAGFLREEARLAIIYVSDDEDCSHEGGLPLESSEACAADPASLVDVSDYLVRYEGLKADPLDVSVHALVETGTTGEFEGCGGSNPAVRIMRAARGTGGLVAPLCGDLSLSFTELGKQLTGRRSAFPLSRRPDAETISVRLETTDVLGEPAVVLVRDITMQNGWTWDEASNSIRLWGDAVPELGTAVKVRYIVGVGG
jgi:hypothetical protein